MTLSGILAVLNELPAYRSLCEALKGSPPRLPAQPLGLLAAARPALLAALHAHTRRPLLVLVARADHARSLAQEIEAWTPTPQAVMRLPDPDALPYERVAWGRDTICERVRVLAAMAGWRGDSRDRPPPLVITSARAIMQKTAPPALLRSGLNTLQVGQQVALNELMAGWLDIGYRPTNVVEQAGDFSRRGGILDIFSPNLPHPMRIELFGEEIESLRMFDPLTQRSEKRVTAFDIVPAHEALTRLAPRAAEKIRRLDFSSCHPMARLSFEEDIQQLSQANTFRGIEFYLPFFYDPPASPLDYLPTDGLLVVDDPSELEAVLTDLEQQAQELQRDWQRQGESPVGWPKPYFGRDELIDRMRRSPQLLLAHTDWTGGPSSEISILDNLFSPAPMYGGQVKRMVEELVERQQVGQRSVLVTRQSARLSDLLSQRGATFRLGQPLSAAGESSGPRHTAPPPPASITLVQGTLAEGWVLAPDRVPEASATLVLTDTEIFGYHKPEPRRRPASRRAGAASELFFTDLQPGDYVVHVEHGIGIFRGLVKLSLEGVEHEYLQVDYAANDKLYVPIHQADRLSRYVGVDDRPPQIYRLGTADWNLVKRRADRAVEEIAEELLELYAARELSPGHAFLPDSPWQQELEAAFPYVETEDQLRAIEQVKADMEQPKPMDRLICGDVGYGKTEVALRAAFKAVTDGMQVAVLVPTTVLAQQHYQTFVERLKHFPVVVEMLSRFRSRKEQQEVLDGMAKGVVDIVIGTHRLLQKDVRFKSLGLLIIDEEQRFGVSHKERLKKMRTEVDVLTLTATPIPRTLYMSLSGVRDMSTIDTPPADRQPIKTTISEYDETLIRTAILREIDRGGQVFFVHDRVIGIEQMAKRLAKLVPEASLAVAHGQMPESQLEQVMMDFVAGRYDVLVCTSIIESGLDIPNANTIIINRADRFGLAQLYQLRGRVGRGAVRAYAYLLTPKNFELGEAARKRLQALVEASDLGAGFRLAMRDLEMRGAGDLLGARQHGHIAAVGFDLYCRLLARAVRERRKRMQGEVIKEQEDQEALTYLAPLAETIQISLPLPAYLPETYVSDATLRLRLYRRLAGLLSEEEVNTMAQELGDRFGKLPAEVINLMDQLRIKVLAMEAGVQAIKVEAGQIVIKADTLENLDRAGLQRRLGPQIRVARRQIWMPLHPKPAIWQAELEKILRLMGRMLHDPGA